MLVESAEASYNRPMSEAIAFDTHRFVKRLTENGFTEQQAETLAEEHVALLNSNLATKADIAAVTADIEALRLATKTDIEALRKELKADIEALRQGTKADIAALKVDIEAVKADLLKWMFGALIAQGGLIVALINFL